MEKEECAAQMIIYLETWLRKILFGKYKDAKSQEDKDRYSLIAHSVYEFVTSYVEHIAPGYMKDLK